MADSLVDGEFWLPPKFLNDDDDDDDIFLEAASRGLGNGFPLGSPLQSLLASSETESDEDEHIAGLTTQMARSRLHTSHVFSFGSLLLQPSWASSASPPSTLCGSTRRGSPNTHFPQPTLDLLYAAAGEVSKIHLNQHPHPFLNSRPHSKPQSHAAVYQQLQAAQFLQLTKQQLFEQMKLKGSSVRHPPPQHAGRNGHFFKPPPRKHTPPTTSGMRAVFLASPAGKRECAGTGVFLPRQVAKKPPCSTVLVPARVMQALNLNLDDMYVQQRLQTRSPPVINSANNDVWVRIGNENLAAQHKPNLRVTVPPPLIHEIRLPQEWAY